LSVGLLATDRHVSLVKISNRQCLCRSAGVQATPAQVADSAGQSGPRCRKADNFEDAQNLPLVRSVDVPEPPGCPDIRQIEPGEKTRLDWSASHWEAPWAPRCLQAGRSVLRWGAHSRRSPKWANFRPQAGGQRCGPASIEPASLTIQRPPPGGLGALTWTGNIWQYWMICNSSNQGAVPRSRNAAVVVAADPARPGPTEAAPAARFSCGGTRGHARMTWPSHFAPRRATSPHRWTSEPRPLPADGAGPNSRC
jgi:hypothetical protein